MQTKKDYSYGVIPLIKVDDGWEVFLIYQYGSKDDVYWTFPKGHPEKGETPEETAQRELFEETNITLERLEKDTVYAQSYSFHHGDTLIDKSVVYYLGFTTSKDFSLQEDEVKEAGWFTLEAAREQLTHDLAKKMFDTAVKNLEKLQ